MIHSTSTAGTDTPARTVRCPHCRGDSVYSPGNVYRPFCSQRCKQADLGAWASEQFRMPAEASPDAADPEPGSVVNPDKP